MIFESIFGKGNGRNKETENSLDDLKSFLKQKFEELGKSQKELRVNVGNFTFNVKAGSSRLNLFSLERAETIYFKNGEPVSINVKKDVHDKEIVKIDFSNLGSPDELFTTAPLTHAFYINQKK